MGELALMGMKVIRGLSVCVFWPYPREARGRGDEGTVYACCRGLHECVLCGAGVCMITMMVCVNMCTSGSGLRLSEVCVSVVKFDHE